MKDKIMSDEMTKAVEELGKLMREDPRYKALIDAEERYNNDPEMTRLVTEYNVQQTALTAQYAEKKRDEELIHAIENRIGEIYDAVTKNEMYEEYLRAKADYDELYSQMSTQLEFAITGKMPCTHDCSTCGGCH